MEACVKERKKKKKNNLGRNFLGRENHKYKGSEVKYVRCV